MTRDMSSPLRSRLLVLALTLVAAAPDSSRSALEADPAGWTDLLAGLDASLRGWTRLTLPPGGTPSEPSQWRFDGSKATLVCEGTGGHEWLRWDREQGDFVYHVEWRFTPATTGKMRYNSGVYARNSADGKIWHQAQTGDASGGFLFADTLVDGKPQRVNLSKQVTDKRVKPVGEWNTYEITCKGKEMTLWVNGAVTCEWRHCEVPRGFVGLEAEGYRIEFRNVKLKPL